MKQKRNAGFSLVEVLIAIVLLGVVAVPTCTSLVMSIRLNERTEEMLHAQLAVSSTVETLMAEGIMGNVSVDGKIEDARFPDVDIHDESEEDSPYCKVTVTSKDGLVSVTTHVRKVDPPVEAEQPEGGSQ